MRVLSLLSSLAQLLNRQWRNKMRIEGVKFSLISLMSVLFLSLLPLDSHTASKIEWLLKVFLRPWGGMLCLVIQFTWASLFHWRIAWKFEDRAQLGVNTTLCILFPWLFLIWEPHVEVCLI